MSRSLVVNSCLTIPGKEITLTFVRSRGPGGQNVNKVNSKAVLRWSLSHCDLLPDSVKTRFVQLFPSRVNQRGEVVIASDRHRDQLRNAAQCYEILRELIRTASTLPPKRKRTSPTRSSVERRLTRKRKQSAKKQQRGFRPTRDD